jgi:hypothetical protein
MEETPPLRAALHKTWLRSELEATILAMKLKAYREGDFVKTLQLSGCLTSYLT